MPKRTTHNPYARSESEQKIDTIKRYDQLVRKPSNINPIFLERPHYGISEPKKEEVK